MTSPTVLEFLELRNFGVHKHLVIEQPSAIMLIVGPNGVGKTTIADALSLVLGGGSDRFQHIKEIASYRTGDESYVKVILNNLTDDEGNFLVVTNPNYASSQVSITLHLTEKNVYWTVNQDKTHRNRKYIRNLLSTGKIKIDMQDEIYYTKKDTVDLFMSGSPTAMFNQLMSPLNLADLRQNIEDLQEKVRGLQKKVPELSYRQDSLRRDLEKAEERKIQYEEKLRLLSQLEEIFDIKKWIEYSDLEKELYQYEKEYRAVADSTDRLRREIVERQSEFNEFLNDRSKLERLIQNNKDDQYLLQRKIDTVTEKLVEIRTRLIAKEEEIENYNKSLLELKDKQTQTMEEYWMLLEQGAILDIDEFNESIQKLEEEKTQADSELSSINRELKLLEQKKRKIEGQIKKNERSLELLKQEIERESGIKITGGTNYWENERKSLQLRQLVENEPWSEDVTLPIFKEIFLTEKGAEIEGAVNYAIGENKAYLLAKGYETLNSLRLLMERKHFSLSAAPIPERVRQRPKVSRKTVSSLPPKLRQIVIATLDEVIEIDNVKIQSFIYEKVKAVFAKSSAHYRELSELARRLQCDVITPVPSVFKSDGSFKTNVKYSRSLATRRVDLTKITELEDKRFEVESTLPELRLELQKVKEEINTLSSGSFDQTNTWTRVEAELKKVRRLDPRPYLVELDDISRNLESSSQRLSLLEEEKKELEKQLQGITKAPLVQALNEKKDEEKEYRELLEKLNQELFDLDAILKTKEEELQELQLVLEEKENLVVDTEALLISKKEELRGERPVPLPDESSVQRQIIELETRVRMNPSTEKDLHIYESLKKEYEQLGDISEKLTATLNETLEILKEHQEKWKHIVIQTVQKIKDTANYLLSPRLKIECAVVNSLNMKEVGLEILFEDLTKSGELTDFKFGSGGEMALITQALFLTLHTLHYDSPLHIIDEFSQRLDEGNRGHALIMVTRVLDLILKDQERRLGGAFMIPQIFLIAPIIAGSYIPDEIETNYLIKVRKLYANEEFT